MKVFDQQNVVITGGSRGLGYALAQEFLREKAQVILLARDSAELERAKQKLSIEFPDGKISVFTVDVTEAKSTQLIFAKIVETLGPVTTLVNNAGSILVSPYDSLVEADFRAQIELHLFAVIRLCRLAVDQFREHGVKGRIVNICSLGGKIAVPHMLTYDTSKFALAGYSQGLNSELAPEGISVTTIYPTVMRTGSPIQAVFKGDHEAEYTWFASSDNLPFLSLSAESAARKIVRAAKSRRAELIPSFAAKIRLIAGVCFPELTAWTMGTVTKALPQSQSKTYQTGAESEAQFKKTALYRAKKENIARTQANLNQVPKTDALFNAGIKSISPEP